MTLNWIYHNFNDLEFFSTYELVISLIQELSDKKDTNLKRLST